MLHYFKQKIDALTLYFFPQKHSLSLHSSHINANTLFYIRLFSFLYLTGIYIWSITIINSALNNIIYLTMQGYFLTWLYFLLCLQDYVVNGYGRSAVRSTRVLPLSQNLKYYVEIVYEIAFCVELPITTIFWGFLFKLILDTDASIQVIIINANLHAAPLITLVLDTVFNSFSFPKQHFHAVLFFSLLYAIINVSYSLAAHIIYKPIDWVSVLSYVLMAGAVVMAFFMHWLGRTIYNKFKKDKLTEIEGTQGLISTKDDNNEIGQIKRSTGDTNNQNQNKKQNNQNVGQL